MTDRKPRSAPRVISLDVALLLGLSALFFWLWYESYLGVEFNELGRHFDVDQQVVLTDSAFVWCLPAICFLLIAVVKVVSRMWRRRRFGLKVGNGQVSLPGGP